jgi:DNA-directed RNA polymerase subunit alpha
VSELDLPPRTINYLQNDGIVCVGDLVQKTEDEILRLPDFGRPTLRAIKGVLANMGLALGMKVRGRGRVIDRSE